jgi:outer membrane protein OmpA-like peptidoglycan-associated protein
MRLRIVKSFGQVLALAAVVFAPIAVLAQDSPAPAKKAAPATDSPSKWDIFVGYSYLAPHGYIENNSLNGPTVTDNARDITYGVIGSVARYFNNYVGVQAEGDYHNDSSNNKPNDHFSGGSLGMIFRYPTEDITPFVHALVGGERAGSSYADDQWGVVLTVGGGVDYNTPWFNHRLALRIFQADYQYSHINFDPVARGNYNMARLSAGVVFKVGTIAPPLPVTISCAANPTSVFPGDPVTMTATAGMLNPKEHTVYSWSGQGVTGADTTAKVDTSALAPGSYTVNCGVKEGRPGKEGMRPWQTASGTANFTVKEYEPPTISCSANPTDLKPGDSATVTANGMSPQNRPLTYSYAASAGTISGSGTNATFSSTGAPTGPVQITCNVADDKGHTASANSSVTMEPPPPPPGPSPEEVRLTARLALHSIFFPTAQPRADHPEGGLTESQEQTLSTLATDFKAYIQIKPDAHLTLTGHTDPRGSVEYNQALSERRVNRAKAYLVSQGIAESAIDVKAVGKEQELSKYEVKELVDKNSELSDTDKKKVLRQINIIYLAQNRRVDITLTNTGQQSVQLYPFNAADSATLLDEKAPVHRKKAPPKK